MLCSTDDTLSAILAALGLTPGDALALDADDTVFEAPRLREADLRPYQRYLADVIEEHNARLLTVDMGLGKTVSTLTAVRRLLRRRVVSRVLIVGPLLVAQETWPDEVARWEHLADLAVTNIRLRDDDPRPVAAGREEYRRSRAAGATVKEADQHMRAAVTRTRHALQRANALDGAEIHIINREQLQWLWEAIGGLKGWRWDMLVYDESSRLKGFNMRSAGGKRKGETRAEQARAKLSEFGVLASARSKISRVVELTGTPTPNGVLDLGGQAYILDGGQRLGRSKTAFKARWFDEDRYTHSIKPKPFAYDEIMELMADVMVGLRAEDHIDLPKQLFVDVPVKLPPKIMEEYEEFESSLVSETYDVEAASRGVLANKLLQFANGALYRTPEGVENPKREVIELHTRKLDALESIVEEASGANMLVAYNFKFDLERIAKRFRHAVIFDNEPDFVKKWNAGKIRMGLCHPASMGHGLNLQFGGHIQVWYGLTWSLELYQQFNRRLARPGQAHPHVNIYRIVAKGTNDETVVKALHRKGATQDSVINAVKVRILQHAA